MKNVKISIHLLALLLVVIFLSNNLNAQTGAGNAFKFSIQNITHKTDNIIEFDLYLLNLSSGNPFELALLQAGILVNPEIYNGGQVKATIIEGSSQLNEGQQPTNTLFAQNANIIKLPSRTLKPLVKDAPATKRGSTISTKEPGSRICTLRLTNTVAFSKAPLNLKFNFERAPYPTSVSQYIAGVNTPLICNPTNCVVIVNRNENPK